MESSMMCTHQLCCRRAAGDIQELKFELIVAHPQRVAAAAGEQRRQALGDVAVAREVLAA